MRRYFFLAAALVMTFGALSHSAAAAEQVNCFDYYRFGSVEAKLSTDLASVSTGSTIHVTGVLTNDNPYPIVDGGLRIKVFRKAEGDEKQPNGPAVVDQFDVLQGVSLGAHAQKSFSFDWTVPTAALSGNYQFATFFSSSKKFNLLGLSFTDDVVGNTLDFSVTDGRQGIVEFDKASGTYNGNPYVFAAYAPRVSNAEPFLFSIDVTNTTGADKQVPVIWKLYSWDSLLDANLISTSQDVMTVKADGKTTLQYAVTDKSRAVYYLVGEIRYEDSRSLIGVRFVRDGVDQIRINFPGVTTFPLAAGTSTAVFSCLHSAGTADVVPGGKMVLTLNDKSGNVIYSTSYKTDVTGNMMGVADSFVPTKTYDQFSLTAELYKNGTLVDTASKNYDCMTIDKSLCSPATRYGIGGASSDYMPIIAALGGLIAAIALFVAVKRRKKIGTGALVLFALLAMGAAVPHKAHAGEAYWSTTNVPRLFVPFSSQGAAGTTYSGIRALEDVNVTVKYHANVIDAATGAVIKSGSSIPAGTKIKLAFTPFSYADLYWFATGYAGDSPYGSWIANAAKPNAQCADNDFVTNSSTICDLDAINSAYNNWKATCGSGLHSGCKLLPYRDDGLAKKIFGFLTGAADAQAQTLTSVYSAYKVYAPFAVNPPAKSLTGTSDLGCGSPNSNGDVVCTPTKAGAYKVTFKFGSTYGKFYYQTKATDSNTCQTSNLALRTGSSRIDTPCGQLAQTVDDGDYSLSIPAQSITVSLNVTAAQNSAPAITISGPSTGETGKSYSFSFTGSDPEKDAVYYSVDWDNNGVADDRLPSSGTVASGKSQTASHMWTTSGKKTFQALAKDDQGASSGWKKFTIDISAAAADTAPEGKFESATCSALTGWALDQDTPTKSIDVHVYKDNPSGSGTFIGYYTTDVSRSDVNSAQSVTGKHGFSITVPDALKDNKAHKVYVYGINSSSAGSNTLLTGSPLTLTCAPTPAYQCADGLDNDGDGKIDFPADPGCADATDNDETDFAPAEPTVTLVATPSSVPSAQSVMISWSSTNAASCAAVGGWTASTLTSGAQTNVYVSKQTTFQMTCTGPGGVATGGVTVSFGSTGGNGGGGGTGSGGCVGAGCSSSAGFTVTASDGNGTVPVQFLSTLGAKSAEKRIDVIPGPGFSEDVTLSVTGIHRLSDGASLPSDVEVVYYLDGNPSVLMRNNAALGRYMNPAGTLGTVFQAEFSKPISDKYVVSIHGASASQTADYSLVIDPRKTDPSFQEI